MGKINVYNKILIGNEKKKLKYENQKFFNIHRLLVHVDGLGIEFTAC